MQKLALFLIIAAASSVKIPDATTGVGLAPIFTSEQSGRVIAARDHVLTGKGDETFDPVPYLGGAPLKPGFKKK